MAFLLLAVAVNFRVVNLKDNMIIKRYGANSICVFIDDPPFNLFAATLYFPVGAMFCMFALTKYWRTHVSFTEERIGACTKNFLLACCVFEVITAIVFIQSFATSPMENELVHALPYTAFQLGIISHGISSFVFFLANQHPKTPRWLFGFGIFSIVTLCIETFLFILIVINAFLQDNAKMWDVSSKFGAIFAGFVLKTYLIFAMVLPMIFHYCAAEYLEDLRIELSADLTDTVDREV